MKSNIIFPIYGCIQFRWLPNDDIIRYFAFYLHRIHLKILLYFMIFHLQIQQGFHGLFQKIWQRTSSNLTWLLPVYGYLFNKLLYFNKIINHELLFILFLLHLFGDLQELISFKAFGPSRNKLFRFLQKITLYIPSQNL